eukprot:1011400-Pelagomonas_calceolata.AAC.1
MEATHNFAQANARQPPVPACEPCTGPVPVSQMHLSSAVKKEKMTCMHGLDRLWFAMVSLLCKGNANATKFNITHDFNMPASEQDMLALLWLDANQD